MAGFSKVFAHRIAQLGVPEPICERTHWYERPFIRHASEVGMVVRSFDNLSRTACEAFEEANGEGLACEGILSLASRKEGLKYFCMSEWAIGHDEEIEKSLTRSIEGRRGVEKAAGCP